MRAYSLDLGQVSIPVYELDTLVVGSGCAGFNGADWLFDLGQRDIAVITEGVNKGTSRNTGSDKQTYYKLSLASDGADSVEEMAHTLFDGGGVHGDTALVEAACSSKCFFKLANLGVPFPTNEYGEYVGYKTDHDPRQRATSAGPLTSKFMTECLERAVMTKNIPIHNHTQIIELLVKQGRLAGALALNLDRMNEPNCGLVLYRCRHMLAATGGPAGVYAASVYPESQTGSTGMLLAAGAQGTNLQSWQFGLASTQFRWNVSGTYQQVLPRYIAVDREGHEREFLNEYFDDPFQAVNMIFLKGYQWPFDVNKIHDSSIIDIIVHHETIVKGNHVYMDFTRNPSCIADGGFSRISSEARQYLGKSGALSGTPIQRLLKMNAPAVELYRNHGIDIAAQPLEVAICAQHCNGGIAVDSNWQSRIQGLYVAGEAAGTFGIHRPGGAALNSTQVGSMRAAEHIAFQGNAEFACEFQAAAAAAAERFLRESCLLSKQRPGLPTVSEAMRTCQQLMTRCASHICDMGILRQVADRLETLLAAGAEGVNLGPDDDLSSYCKYMDTLKTQLAVLSATELSAKSYGSRGASMVLSPEGEGAGKGLEDYRYIPPQPVEGNHVITTCWMDAACRSLLEPVREIPARDSWFENVWKAYMQRTKRTQP